MSEPATTVLFPRLRRRLNRARVRALARRLARQVGDGRAFTCLLAGDAELRRLNREFLSHDYPTDVLSFPLRAEARSSRHPEGTRPAPRVAHASACRGELQLAGSTGYLGDIAISLPRAAAQARRYGHSLEEEIGILMLHGLLHLQGHDHARDRGRMRRAEAHWRKVLGLPAGLAERVRR